MKIITRMEDWDERIKHFPEDTEETLGIGIHPETSVSFGSENDVNLEYIKEHNIPIFDQNRRGGTIVHSKGSITIGFIYTVGNYGYKPLRKMFNAFYRYLLLHGISASIEKNDLLIEGYKVASCVSKLDGENYNLGYEGIQFSTTLDLDLIKKICLKPMEKVPRALSDYGFDTERIMDWIKRYLKANLNIEFE